MEKKVKKIRLRSDAIVLDSKKMSNVIGGRPSDGVCQMDGYWYTAGEVFMYKGNKCRCEERGLILCTKLVIPEDEGCWCTCKCFDATVMGFQLGMIVPQKQGNL